MGLCPFSQFRDCVDSAVCSLYGTGCPLKAGGDTYSKTLTMSDDNATRFESALKTLRDIIIIVSDNDMLFGSTGEELYPVAVDETFGFTRIDISTLYFKNTKAGKNGTVTILGIAD